MRFARTWLLTAVALGLAACEPPDIDTQAHAPPPPQPARDAQIRSPQDPPEWTLVSTFEGSGVHTTARFTVGPNWRVTWDTKPRPDAMPTKFLILSYESGGSLPDVIANVEGTYVGAAERSGAGDYYLEINTGQDWIVEIWEKARVP